MTIGIVGKYVAYEDSYKSLNEALLHGGVASNLRVNLKWIEAEEMRQRQARSRSCPAVDGILIPGGFGVRGVAGMIEAVRYAREKQGPLLRHLPRPAVRGDRGGAQPVRARRAPTPPSSTNRRRTA